MSMGFRAAAAAAGVGLAALALSNEAQASEVFVGAYAHDVTFIGNLVGLGAAGREDGADIHLGYRTGRISGLHAIGSPQAHAFVSINTNNTSNFVAAGLDWRIGIKGPVYFRPGIGLAYTDGKTELPPANVPGLTANDVAARTYLYYHRIAFGSRVLFEPEFALGWDVTDRFAVEASYTHLSNGQIFHKGKNQGLDDAGVRLVYKFGK